MVKISFLLNKSRFLWILVCVILFIIYVHIDTAGGGKRTSSGVNNVQQNKSPGCLLEIDCKRFYNSCSNRQRQNAVKEAFVFAWESYRKHAWGHDHLKPDSLSHDNDLLGQGATLIDSLTTLLLMGLDKQFQLSKEWLKNSFSLRNSTRTRASLFEVSIRLIASLTSTYHLTQDPLFLGIAKEIGDTALQCFNTSSHIPHMDILWAEGRCEADFHVEQCLYQMCNNKGDCTYSYCRAEIAEVGTLGLELRALSYATNLSRYADAVNKTTNKLLTYPQWDGLVGRFLYIEESVFEEGWDIGTGPGVDSYYEYLLKQWVHSDFKATRFKQAYLQAVEGIRKHLTLKMRVLDRELLVLGQRVHNVTLAGEIHHLSCFLPGTLALGVYYGLPKSHLKLAEEVMECCYYLYKSQPTGLSGDVSRFTLDGVSVMKTENNLRPETVESLFILWRVTKQHKYREWGWNIFQAFERVSRTCNGYTNIADVSDVYTKHLDKQESFFLAETLKYFYLLFEDDDSVLSFDKWVLNTEAHPLPIMRDYSGVY